MVRAGQVVGTAILLLGSAGILLFLTPTGSLFGFDFAQRVIDVHGPAVWILALLGGVATVFFASTAIAIGGPLDKLKTAYSRTFHGIPWSFISFIMAMVALLGIDVGSRATAAGLSEFAGSAGFGSFLVLFFMLLALPFIWR